MNLAELVKVSLNKWATTARENAVIYMHGVVLPLVDGTVEAADVLAKLFMEEGTRRSHYILIYSGSVMFRAVEAARYVVESRNDEAARALIDCAEYLACALAQRRRVLVEADTYAKAPAEHKVRFRDDEGHPFSAAGIRAYAAGKTAFYEVYDQVLRQCWEDALATTP